MKKELWVYLSLDSGNLHAYSAALLGRAQQLAAENNMDLAAVVVGSDSSPVAHELAKIGVQKVYYAAIAGVEQCDYMRIVNILEPLVKEREPEIFLFPATDNASLVASSLGVRLRTGVNVHCVSADIRDGIFIGTVPAFGGQVMSEILCPQKKPQMATVRLSGYAFTPCTPGDAIPFVEKETHETPVKLLNCEDAPTSGLSLDDANVLLCAGAGIADEEGYQALTELANLIGAGVCCTRAALDLNIGAVEEQMVGISGITISPRVYIGFGASGSAHHQFGMLNSDVVLNVNRDENCPFFKDSECGYVGDAKDVLAALIKAVK